MLKWRVKNRPEKKLRPESNIYRRVKSWTAACVRPFFILPTGKIERNRTFGLQDQSKYEHDLCLRNQSTKTKVMTETEIFTTAFGDVIKRMMNQVLDEREKRNEQSRPVEYYSREEVCRKLHICHATYHNWQKKGVFRTKKIGNKVFVLKDKFDEDFAEEKFIKFRIRPLK